MLIRCVDCGKHWRFTESKEAACTCGHVMNIKVELGAKPTRPKLRSIPGARWRFVGGGIGSASGTSNGSRGWTPQVIREGSGRKHQGGALSSIYYGEKVIGELKDRLLSQLSELQGFVEEGLDCGKVLEGIKDQLREL